MSKHTIEMRITAKDLASSVVTGFANQLGGLGKLAIGALGAAGVAGVAAKATKAVWELVKSTSGLYNVKQAFDGLNASAGRSSAEMLKALQSAAAGMITQSQAMTRFNTASSLVSKDFAATLPDAMQYLVKVAAATGKDLDYLLDSYVTGVGRLSGPILDNLAIQVSQSQATERAAKMFGVAADATTKYQQQMAMADLVLEKLAANTASMPDVTKSAAAGLTALNVRFKDAADQVGMSLQPVVASLVWRLNDLAGKVLPPLVNLFETRLAPALGVIADKLIGVSQVAEQAGTSFLNKFGGKMAQSAEAALRWGVNIATQLATGIVQGASSALIAAMNWIGGLLSRWLSPGSPPKVAPDIDKWGMAAMEQFLRGFQDADFGILEGMQGSLQTALSALSNMGAIASDQVGPMFASLSKDIAGAVAQFNATGQVGSGVFERLNQLGGQFGSHLADMLRGQLDLAAATKQLQDAQDRLNAARDKENAAVDKIKALKSEYFALRKSGASPEVIKAKLAEIKATQNGLKAARAEAEAAEQAKTEAEKKLDPIRQQVSLQEKMIAQLSKLVSLQEQSAEAALGGIGGGAGGAAGAGLALPEMDIAPITAPLANLTTAFEDAKAGIAEKLKDIFKPLTDAWETKMKPALDELKTKWGEFKEMLQAFWDSPAVQKIRDWIAGLFPEGTIETIGKWAGAIGIAMLALLLLFGVITLLTSPLVLLGIGIAILAGLWTKHGDEIKQTAMMLAAIVLKKLLDWYNGLLEFIGKAAQWGLDLLDWWDRTATSIEQGLTNFVLEFIDIFQGWIDNVGTKFTEGTEAWSGIFENWQLAMQTIRDNIGTDFQTGVDAWSGIFENAKTIFSTLWTNITNAIKTALSIDWLKVGGGIIDGIKSGISGAASGLAQAAAQAAADALAAAKAFLGIQSPSKKAAKEIGKPFMEGLARGLAQFSILPEAAMSQGMRGLMNSAFAPGVGAAGGLVPSPAMAAAGGAGGLAVYIQGDVWSDRKVDEIANAIDRRQRMRGARRL